MKNQLQFFAFTLWLLAFSLTVTAQTVRRVNGDPNITGVNVYNTIQAAVDAANTDDVIQIDPYCSGVTSCNLGTVEVNKRLHFRGNAYVRNGSNNTIELQNSNSPLVSAINFNFGSSGSSVRHMNVSLINIKDSGISIIKSKADYISLNKDLDNSSNQLLSEGTSPIILSSVLKTVSDDRANLTSTNATISNCIFWNAGGYARTNLDRLSSSVVTNSIFRNGGGYLFFDNHNVQFNNNIFIANSIEITISSQNIVFNNNICLNGTHLPATNSNQNNVAFLDVFSGPEHTGNEIISESETFENSLKLSPTSLAIGTGTNGIDIGPWSGQNPYQVSGLPNAPLNTDFFNSSIGSNTTNISATATFKAN